jgi:hypothetical protein
VNPAQDFYFYFGVDDFFIFSGDEPDLFITIDYYDVGTAALTLQYDAASAIYKDGGSVSRTNTNTWKQHTFHVTDAFFGNRQNNGADFRILGSSSTITLDVITVATEQPLPPIIEEVAPDPEIAHVGVAYTKQLMLVQGSPPPTWSVIQAPPGTQVSIIGHVSGWTPAGADVGDHVFEIEASNDHGTDTETWTVRVKSPKDIDGDGDVDVTDYGYVQECYSGNGFPYTPACAPYDYDSDGDVDHLDGDLFEACMSGAGVTPDC